MSNPYSDAEYARRVKQVEDREKLERIYLYAKDMFDLLKLITMDSRPIEQSFDDSIRAMYAYTKALRDAKAIIQKIEKNEKPDNDSRKA